VVGELHRLGYLEHLLRSMASDIAYFQLYLNTILFTPDLQLPKQATLPPPSAYSLGSDP
jgi:hypothetical protein